MSKEKTSLYERDKAYKKALRVTRDRSMAVKAYCGGNKWANENARAVGNIR